MKRGDVCYGMLRAEACVDEWDPHALMYVRHGQTVREEGVDESSNGLIPWANVNGIWYFLTHFKNVRVEQHMPRSETIRWC